jgi:hypothetical protein
VVNLDDAAPQYTHTQDDNGQSYHDHMDMEEQSRRSQADSDQLLQRIKKVAFAPELYLASANHYS